MYTSLNVIMMLLVLSLLYAYTVAQSYVINAVIVSPQIKCWRCPNKTDNEACNDWAPDKYCPINFTICQTRHLVDVVNGKSIRVTKMCALPQDCTAEMIGCHPTKTPGVQECISCCNYQFCNEQIPFNHTSALLFSSLPTSGASSTQYQAIPRLKLTLNSFLTLICVQTLVGLLSMSQFSVSNLDLIQR